MIPTWIYVALSVALLIIPPVWQGHRINQRRDAGRDNLRAVDAERRARENSYPLGNSDRWFG